MRSNVAPSRPRITIFAIVAPSPLPRLIDVAQVFEPLLDFCRLQHGINCL
jgi:hypothetical protein